MSRTYQGSLEDQWAWEIGQLIQNWISDPERLGAELVFSVWNFLGTFTISATRVGNDPLEEEKDGGDRTD